eukprot:5442569-Pyramimonas_sp.AAC.1
MPQSPEPGSEQEAIALALNTPLNLYPSLLLNMGGPLGATLQDWTEAEVEVLARAQRLELSHGDVVFCRGQEATVAVLLVRGFSLLSDNICPWPSPSRFLREWASSVAYPSISGTNPTSPPDNPTAGGWAWRQVRGQLEWRVDTYSSDVIATVDAGNFVGESSLVYHSRTCAPMRRQAGCFVRSQIATLAVMDLQALREMCIKCPPFYNNLLRPAIKSYLK